MTTVDKATMQSKAQNILNILVQSLNSIYKK